MQYCLAVGTLLVVLPVLPVSRNVTHSTVICNSFGHAPFRVVILVYAGKRCVENLLNRRVIQVGLVAVSVDAVKHLNANPVQSGHGASRITALGSGRLLSRELDEVLPLDEVCTPPLVEDAGYSRAVLTQANIFQNATVGNLNSKVGLASASIIRNTHLPMVGVRRNCKLDGLNTQQESKTPQFRPVLR